MNQTAARNRIRRRLPAGWPACMGVLLQVFLGGAAAADTPPLILAIQPVQREATTHAVYQPLADYIGKVTGKKCVLLTHNRFFSYWYTIHQGKGYDLALDEAHFTDYRLQKLGFTVLVKAPDMVTYSLIMLSKKVVANPAQLVGRRIATLGIPSVGAARLNAIFPNPSRQPITMEINSAEQGMQLLLDGKVQAAILPTPFVNQQKAQGVDVRAVLLTEPIPNIALSAGPSLPADTREALRKALLDADKNDDGRKMLRAMGMEKFEPATAAIYTGQSRILAEYWGY
jgi:uncharacterized membrane protein